MLCISAHIHYFSLVQLRNICHQITFRIKHIPLRKMCEIFRAKPIVRSDCIMSLINSDYISIGGIVDHPCLTFLS